MVLALCTAQSCCPGRGNPLLCSHCHGENLHGAGTVPGLCGAAGTTLPPAQAPAAARRPPHARARTMRTRQSQVLRGSGVRMHMGMQLPEQGAEAQAVARHSCPYRRRCCPLRMRARKSCWSAPELAEVGADASQGVWLFPGGGTDQARSPARITGKFES